MFGAGDRQARVAHDLTKVQSSAIRIRLDGLCSGQGGHQVEQSSQWRRLASTTGALLALTGLRLTGVATYRSDLQYNRKTGFRGIRAAGPRDHLNWRDKQDEWPLFQREVNRHLYRSRDRIPGLTMAVRCEIKSQYAYP